MDPCFSVVSVDVYRGVTMKSVVKAHTADLARDSFEAVFAVERFVVEEVRRTIELELDHLFEDGTSLRELVTAVEFGVVAWTTDLE